MIIREFQGEFRFLSNFFPAPTRFEGIVFPSSEHAYVAAKTFDLNTRMEIKLIETPGQVKRFGRTLVIRPDWEMVKTDIMRTVVRSKFLGNRALLWRLLATGKDTLLVEGNTWHDNTWGECSCKRCENKPGENRLGRILMELRDTLLAMRDV